MKRKTRIAAVLFLLLTVLLPACNPVPPSEAPDSIVQETSSTPVVQKPTKIGISFPTQSLPQWNNDGKRLKEKLEAAGYEVDLQFGADSEIPIQIEQTKAMISNGCTVLVVADVTQGLSEVLKGAKEKEIPVISYDRRIMDSDAVSYHVAFDYKKIGATQGQYIVDRLDLENQDGPFYIELFAGAPDNNDALSFWNGAIEVLRPYIDNGKLVVRSGETEFQECATENGATENAQMRMENLISARGYGPNRKRLDAVLCPNDSIASGITNSLDWVGGYTADNFPIVTGQDCDLESVKNIRDGFQSMSVFNDTNDLVERTVKMVISLVNGEEPEVNDTKGYDSGFGPVPAYLCDPSVIVTKDNYKEVLIDSGYYQEWELMN